MPQTLQAVIGRIVQATQWITHRWGLSETPQPWTVLAFAIIVTALVLHPRTWGIVRHGATLIHEMGHVAMAWLWGRRVEGIRLHSDTSGLTITAGKQRGLGVFATFLAGYPAPALLGLALIWASTSGYSGAALTALMLVLVLALWLTRNLFGLLVLGVALLSAGAVFWAADPLAVTCFTVATGIFLVLAGLRTCFDLLQTHRHGEDASGSDASMLAQHSLLPAPVWCYVFIAASLACMLQGGRLLARAMLG